MNVYHKMRRLQQNSLQLKNCPRSNSYRFCFQIKVVPPYGIDTTFQPKIRQHYKKRGFAYHALVSNDLTLVAEIKYRHFVGEKNVGNMNFEKKHEEFEKNIKK